MPLQSSQGERNHLYFGGQCLCEGMLCSTTSGFQILAHLMLIVLSL
jgi:hypothetical protein